MLKCGLRRMARALGFCAALVAGNPVLAARPQCKLVKYLELPVELIGGRAIVTTQINGKEARFILDSGLFYSVMSLATAAEFHLKLQAAPPSLAASESKKSISLQIGTAENFTLGGVKLPKVEFLIGGTDSGAAGRLGQNFLSMYDVDYDFAHGVVRLLRATNCPDISAAYWATDRPVTAIPLESQPPYDGRTVGMVTLDGVKLRARFATGAMATAVKLSAAKRAGVTPQSPGVVEPALGAGMGSQSQNSWMGTFQKLDIGGEAIPHPRLRVADLDLDEDMRIGFDFFLTHHVLVLNSANRMLVTYEGGPVFGLAGPHAQMANGTAIDLSHKDEAAPKDADGLARRGAVFASQGKLDAAIADLDAAVALAPADPHILAQRAGLRIANQQPLLALNDLDKVITIDPADPDPYLQRALIRLRLHSHDDALVDLTTADKALPPSSDKRLQLAGLFKAADANESALANDDLWLKFHPEDAQRSVALGRRCWTRALLNRELDKALSDCNAALRDRPNTAGFIDSRALVHFRRGEWALAKADYDAALPSLPRNALGLYVRGLARAKLGDAAGAAADRAAALAQWPAVADRAKKLGLES